MDPAPGIPLLLMLRAPAGELPRAAAELARRAKLNLAEAFHWAANTTGQHRLAVVAREEEMAEKLLAAASRLARPHGEKLVIRNAGVYAGTRTGPTGKVAVLFPGQGSQAPGMLSEARQHFPEVGAWFEALDEAHRRQGRQPPSSLLTARPGSPESGRLFDIAWGAQLGTVASLGLFELMSSWGIAPDVFIGHSNGEHAAVLAACLPASRRIEAACQWVCRASGEGRLLPAPDPPEGMIAVGAIALDSVKRIIAPHAPDVFLAMENCPGQMVVAGREGALRAVAKELKEAGAACGTLPFTRAYHTPLFAPWSALLRSSYENLPLERPARAVVSCLDGQAMPPDAAGIRAQMAAQWVAPVRFHSTINQLYENGARVFLEAGPDSKLSAFVEDILRGREFLAASTCSLHRGDREQLAHFLAALHMYGVPFDYARVAGVYGARQDSPTPSRFSVPHDVVEAQRHLVADARRALARVEAIHPPDRNAPRVHARLGESQKDRESRRTRRRLSLVRDPWLAEHSFGRLPDARATLPVISFTTSIALAAEAAAGSGMRVARLSGIRAGRWLAMDHEELSLEVAMTKTGTDLHVTLGEAAPGEAAAFEARFSAQSGPAADFSASLAAGFVRGRPPERWSARDFYERYAFHGPGFQGLRRVVSVSAEGVEAELEVLPSMNLHPDPALFDCAGQLVAFWLLEYCGREPSFGIFPFAMNSMDIFSGPLPAGSKIVCRAAIRLEDNGVTESSFHFHRSDGLPVASLHGLQQRLIELPAALAYWILRGPPARFSVGQPAGTVCSKRSLAPGEWDILGEHGEIWQRSLARMVCAEQESAAWHRLRDREARRELLLQRILVKETVADWLSIQHGASPRLCEIVLDDRAEALISLPGAPRPRRLQVRREEGAIYAEVE